MLRERLSPWRLIAIAAVLLTVGMVLPWLMVLGVLATAWVWNVTAFLSSVVGLFLGSLGITMYVHLHRKRNGENPLEEIDPRYR